MLRRRVRKKEEMSLQITSMADIFIIILVFLLKSYATGMVNINPSAGIKLPETQASELAVDALKVEISKNGVQIEGNSVISLKDYTFSGNQIQNNGSSLELASAFEKERKKQILIAKNNENVKLDPRLILIADQKIPYSTIKTVLASAALNGYTDFKLAVVHGD